MLIWATVQPGKDMDGSDGDGDDGGAVFGPPDGPLPENSYESRVDLILGVTISMLAVTTVFAALRVYVRALVLRKWGVDDTMLVLSFVALMFHGVIFGLGRHVWMTPVGTIIKGQKLAMVIIMIYQIAFVTIKITFLLQYRRVFPLPRVEMLCNVGIGFLVLFGISLVVSAGVTYSSIFSNNFWNSPIDILGWWLSNAAIHLVTDILIFILPLPLLNRLRLRRPQKAALIASFALGSFTCAISALRIASLPESLDSVDMTYEGTPTIVWSVAELSSAFICCCIPTLRPLVQRSRYLPGGSAFSGSGSYGNAPRTRPDVRNAGRQSSSVSCESDVVMRKTNSSFFWQRSRQRSEHSTVADAAADEIGAAAAPMPMPLPTMATPPPRPVTPMPSLEVSGLRRASVATTVDSLGNPLRDQSVRSSVLSDRSLGFGIMRDLSARRHLSMALTERDSDDDIYYFGVNEEVDLECPTPLSPPPKCRKSTSS
ncbi:hypothetical protein CCHL11_01341 [Colletotrichum chlorophyti]|uniref:Rhodopsin domain-containing protein n=1 Tax=Colletotrichum chlorophyti TaxID=708187 RepID=A0A1Q8RYB4_9PEZI|nr:hypothetical protein CCHL11_01341 [Colletotrichum chlorophyti]